MTTLYRLHPMQWMRDHNQLIQVLSAEICSILPDTVVIEDVADKLEFKLDGNDYYINECELVLDLGDRVIAITMLDNASNLLQLIADRNNPRDLLIYSQPDNFREYISDRSVRGVYVTRDAFLNLDAFYQLRLTFPSFVDKFVFRGNYEAVGRGSVQFLMQPEYRTIFAGPGGFNPQEYFEDIIQYKMGLSLPGIGELCYRDLEYMAVGLPMLRFDYEHPLNPPLIPNYHYISIPRFADMPWLTERAGSKEIAEAYVARFNEVKNDYDLLSSISKNAKQYYEDNFSLAVRVPRTLKMMGLYNG